MGSVCNGSCGQEVIEVFEGYDCSSWMYGLTNDDLDCLTKEQWLNDRVLLNAKQ